MRILYSFPHSVGKPGIGTTALNQVESVARQGIEVVLYCTTLDQPLQGDVAVVETMRFGRRRLPHRVVGVDRAYRFHDRRVATALRGLRGKIDLVHGWPRGSLATFRAARAVGIPSLREVPNTHTGFAYEAVAREYARLGLEPEHGHSHTFDAAILEREEAEYNASDVLLVPSEFARRTFVDRGIPADKLALHQYGFDGSQFPPRAETGTATHGLKALFVGACEPRKGLHHALAAWVESGAAERGHFVICGGFAPGYREAIARWLDHPSVEVRGFVEDPGALMRESDIFLFPSIEEGSALVTYEAQASGCVLVVSDAAGARVDHERQGLVHTAGDVATLTSHLRRFDQDRLLLEQFRRATLARRSELTWDHGAVELARIYAATAAAHASSGAPAGSA